MNSNEVTVQQLDDLYKNNKTSAERAVFLKTAKLLNPELAGKLEKHLLRDQIQGLPFDQLITLVAEQKGVHIAEAETLLRDYIFENMLDQSLLVINTEASEVIHSAPASIPTPTAVINEPISTAPAKAVTPVLPAKQVPVRPPNRPVPPSVQRPPGSIPAAPRIIKPLPVIQIGGEVPEPAPAYTPETPLPTEPVENQPPAEPETILEPETQEQAEQPRRRSTFLTPKGVQSE